MAIAVQQVYPIAHLPLVLGRVLKVGGADAPESYSNYAMTGK